MADFDNPLKRLFSDFMSDFAIWLLGDNILSVHPTNIALLPSEDEIRVDELFDVTLTDGRVVTLHIDFQGKRSHRPMPWRVLDYISRIAETYHRDVCSVVIYIGKGAGSDDKGRHQVKCSDGKIVLSWRYRVIHLWKMKADKLLRLNRPALLPLIGQTQIDNPKTLLPKVVKRLRAVEDDETRGRLFSALLALMNDQEMVNMIEKMIAKDNLLLDTPFMRRLREEGSLITRRHDLLDVLVLRFDPPSSLYRQLEEHLLNFSNEAQLKKLFTAAVQSKDMRAFQNVMDSLH